MSGAAGSFTGGHGGNIMSNPLAKGAIAGIAALAVKTVISAQLAKTRMKIPLTNSTASNVKQQSCNS